MSTIKLTNDVKISKNSLELHGVDTSNVIATNVGKNENYTATQDCFFFLWSNANQGMYTDIDGVQGLVYSYYNSDIIPLVKGQVVKMRGYSDATKVSSKVYGMK